MVAVSGVAIRRWDADNRRGLECGVNDGKTQKLRFPLGGGAGRGVRLLFRAQAGESGDRRGGKERSHRGWDT